MKEREKNILKFIIENNGATLDELIKSFDISKRTLYYDIEKINNQIKNCGTIKKITQKYFFIGNYDNLNKIISGVRPVDPYTSYSRQNYILGKIFSGEVITIQKLADELQISKNTCISDMDEIKKSLHLKGLKLQTKPQYDILGDEIIIRELYLIFLQEHFDLIGNISPIVLKFDREHSLQLTDYSLGNFSSLLSFMKMRIKNGHYVKCLEIFKETESFSYYSDLSNLIGENDTAEQRYLAAYIASLPSLNHNVDDSLIENYIDSLIQKFQTKTAVLLEYKDEFKKNIKHHLLSSYYRIKYHFPISNPGLEEINLNNSALFKIIKSIIIECESEFPQFSGMRDEEIGFITAYFGGYLIGNKNNGLRKNRVLLVCPNGLMISKTIQIQLYNYIPFIEVVDTIAVSRLADYDGYYDYIISTIEIPGYDNTIVVNPLLTKPDIQRIMNKLIDFSGFTYNFDVELLIQVIKKNADIINENQLKNDLAALIYPTREKDKERNNPMLKDLITKDRINIVQNVDSWQDAIKLASKPLLDDNSITQSYVDAMIESVNTHGPYIVLDDYFALPHASPSAGVNKLAMSLLIVREDVDLVGKPTNVFLVLSAVDTTTHLDALANLSDVLCERKNIEIFRKGNPDDILKLINNY